MALGHTNDIFYFSHILEITMQERDETTVNFDVTSLYNRLSYRMFEFIIRHADRDVDLSCLLNPNDIVTGFEQCITSSLSHI